MHAEGEVWARRFFVFAFFAAVVADGAVHPLGASIALALFSLVSFSSAAINVHRSAVIGPAAAALLTAWCFVALAIWQSVWHPDTAAANPVWRHLEEQFGASGGTLAVNRLQAIWTLPSIVLPFIAYAAAALLFRRRRDAKDLWTSIAMIGVMFAVYGLLQRTLFPMWHFLWERTAYTDSLSGFYVNRNPAAAFLFMTTLATLAVLDDRLRHMDLFELRRSFHVERRWSAEERRALLLLAAAAIEFLALVLTKSRAGVILGVVSIGLFVSLRLPSHLERARLKPSRRMKLGLLVACVLLVVLLADQVFFRLERQGLDDESRFCLWGSVSRMVVDSFPWGVGMGSFGDAFPGYRSPECGLLGVWETAHDGYLEGAATMGVFFPIFLVGMILVLLPPIVRAHRSDDSGHAAATLISAGALALHSIVDFPLEIPANSVLLGTLIATTIAMSTDPRRDSRRRWRRRRGPTPAADAEADLSGGQNRAA